MKIIVMFPLIGLSGLMMLQAQAEPFNEGPKQCLECHEAEYDVWKQSKHFSAYKAVHKKPESKAILKAADAGKSMKRNKICSVCHYTNVRKTADTPAKAKAGPSCESCHGPSSQWRVMHDDYGGDTSTTAENESPEDKAKRRSNAKSAGMIWPFMHYDIAANCMSCHGLVRDEIEPDIFEKIIAANHPANNDFEFIKYSQGSVRHRFYPPNDSVNAEPSAPELSRLFVIGQAAKLVSASAAAKRASEGAYKAFQTQRVEDAREVLARITDVDAIKALMDAPTEENGRNLADAIKDKDLSSKVGSLLPTKDAYK